MTARFGQIGAVAIGRNEGRRLRRCLESLAPSVHQAVYVDSGSTDGSVDLARSLDVEVIELDTSIPFTAARARNAGLERLTSLQPELEFVQFVDGDCELVEGWLEAAVETMTAHQDAAVVCGCRREQRPDASVYNRLCDMEWNTPTGEVTACGGDSLMRIKPLQQVGGFAEDLIAGEEPELCLRLRQKGWTVWRIDQEMTLHDADMTHFGQWWRRSVRAGHAYAEGRARHGRSAERFRVHEVRSIIEWSVIVPLLGLALAYWTWGASLLAALGAYGWLWFRVRRDRLDRGETRTAADLYARYCIIGKFAQLAGCGQFWLNRFLGRRTGLIEYKGSAPNVGAASEAADGE